MGKSKVLCIVFELYLSDRSFEAKINLPVSSSVNEVRAAIAGFSKMLEVVISSKAEKDISDVNG